MYEDQFGLTGRPFQLTPNPRFWYETETHRKAMAYLGYGLMQGEGFVVVTGEIGAGKTTLMGYLLDGLDQVRVNPLSVVSTAIEADDLLRVVAGQMGIDPAGRSKGELLTAVEAALHRLARAGRRTLLVVDEAQALPVAALEELLRLSDFQDAQAQAVIQVVLLGQPEFRDRLHGPDRLEQLRQRVIASHHLDPMNADEVEAYVAHRLTVAGWQGRPDFADDAFPALFEHSGGIPRRLNQLAGRVMLHAAVEGVELIDGAAVRTVADDLRADLSGPAPQPAPVRAVPPRPVTQVSTPVAEPRTDTADRLAGLEARLEAQDAALRRVLTLLVDWMEADAPAPAVRSKAA